MAKCYIYDITLSHKLFPDQSSVAAALKPWCKKYVFQLEKGTENGFLHYQCRVSLIKKLSTISVKRNVEQGVMPKGNWSLTSGEEAAKPTFSYVMKADTKVDGPWTDKDFEDPPQKTRQLLNFERHQKYGWQETVTVLAQTYDERYISIIYDVTGNNGKSIFTEFLEYHRLACELPLMNSMEDIMQCVMSQEIAKCYTIDMPRGMKKEKLAQFYAGIECLKNGYAYDKRYAFKKKRFDRPAIIVFTNSLPQWHLMSLDRWQIYEMQEDKTLIQRNPAYYIREAQNSKKRKVDDYIGNLDDD